MVEVQLAAVRVDLQTKNPVVLLQEREGARTLPIFIHATEARAIALFLEGHVSERPLTHDLLKNLLEALGARFDRLVVTELNADSGIYLAEMQLEVKGERVVVSCRPSDGIAVAIRAEAPIFVAEELLEAEGFILESGGEDGEAEPPEELVDQFREFIQGVRPEDFA